MALPGGTVRVEVEELGNPSEVRVEVGGVKADIVGVRSLQPIILLILQKSWTTHKENQGISLKTGVHLVSVSVCTNVNGY